MGALWIVKQFPRQILRDLDRFHQRKLADWWRGTRDANGDLVLSSYELLAYLEWMDEEGAFKTDAYRWGRWPSWKQMLAEAANQGYRMHASYLTAHGVEDVSDTSKYEFVDPAVAAERKRDEEKQAADDKVRQSRFESETGLS